MLNDKFVVIVENDESEWSDETGILYHYPKRYSKYLKKGTLAIYYKGKLRNRKFEKTRLTNEPHYFGVAKIGDSYKDKQLKGTTWPTQRCTACRWWADGFAVVSN